MKLLFLSTLFLLAWAATAHLDHNPTLPELLTSSPRFSILVELVKYAGLLDTLTMAKDITIFAPTNYGIRQSAMKVGCPTDSMKETFDCIKFKFGNDLIVEALKYHVVPGVLNSSMVVEMSEFTTLNGQMITRKGLELFDKNPRIRNPKLMEGLLDLKYDSGIAHGINGILFPVPDPKGDGLAKVAMSANKFNILLKLLEKTKLTNIAAGTPYVTIFAPTDYAFRMTAKDIGCADESDFDLIADCLVSTVGLQAVRSILAYHIVSGVITSDRVLQASVFKTLAKVPFFRRGTVLVDQAPAVTNPRLLKKLLDIKFNYGVIHAINRVLIPANTGLGSACDQIEFPLSLKDGSFVPIFKLVTAIKNCMPLQKAVKMCDLKTEEICTEKRGAEMVMVKDMEVSVGKIVAAAKKCESVAMAAKSCKILMQT